ncbi:glycoside hydrolase family 20 protein [Roridomyces roridus]|uniref:Beta-hexosaminidase n=1 Tax=Roridomyces roridus TaxID=1738132 RepID=A0AAD7FV75_9AGAR|nr:glycoside hydrolase family 20 protein [Roridomyces roridus]
MRYLAFLAVGIIPAVSALWPMPRTLTNGSDFLILSPSFAINVDITKPPGDLLAAVAQTKTYLETDKLERLIPGRSASDAPSLKKAGVLPSLTLSLQSKSSPVLSIASEAVKDLHSRSEGYTLSIPADGSPAHLSANSTLGLFRGLTTFTQFWYSDAEGKTTYTNVAPVNIANDVPAYPYRGLMLDTARNFFPVADIKRTLDAMSWVKINTFHWHITDAQSFPLSLPDFPELAAQGAYSSNQIYSAADVQDVATYAAERGIDILMEIDTPGHTTAISLSHPSFVACPYAAPWSSFANEPPAGQLRLATPAAVNFTKEVIGAAAKALPGKYFSTGGDEVNMKCYDDDAQTQADLKASGQTFEQALSAFVGATHSALAALGKSAVVWEEMVLDFNITLAPDTVVMVWISSANAALVAAKGFSFVHAPSDYFYLDCGAGEWIGDDPTGNSWCDPFKTWQHAYTFNPLANITSEQAHLVLGGQQLLWTEQSDANNLDSIVWPRAAASAEIFWTGATLPDGSPLSGTEAIHRLHDLRYRMVQRGVKAIQLQPQWCALRPDLCNINS